MEWVGAFLGVGILVILGLFGYDRFQVYRMVKSADKEFCNK